MQRGEKQSAEIKVHRGKQECRLAHLLNNQHDRLEGREVVALLADQSIRRPRRRIALLGEVSKIHLLQETKRGVTVGAHTPQAEGGAQGDSGDLKVGGDTARPATPEVSSPL